MILVGGAFNDRSTVAGLAAVLAPEFTAVTYDRRGRGDSGDSPAYAVEREIEDLAAAIAHAGGPARVFGHSSGANLALEAAAAGLNIRKVAAYESAYVVEGTRPRPGGDLADRLHALLGQGDRDGAVVLFQTEVVGLPAEMISGMRSSPMWGWFTGLARTLPYDVILCGPGMRLPASRLAAITVPVLAIGGGEPALAVGRRPRRGRRRPGRSLRHSRRPGSRRTPAARSAPAPAHQLLRPSE